MSYQALIIGTSQARAGQSDDPDRRHLFQFHAAADVVVYLDEMTAGGVDHARPGSKAPYRLGLPERMGSGEIHFHTAFDHPAHSTASPRDSLHIALPQWAEAGGWRDQKQFALAHRILNRDYDLILGFGGPTCQEVHRKQQRWVVYNIGDSTCLSCSHRSTAPESGPLPVSFWIMLEVYRQHGRRRVRLKLYPVALGGADADPSPRPIATEEFEKVVEVLACRPTRPWRFNNAAQSTGHDALGHFIALALGPWPEGSRPSRLDPTFKGSDAGDWPLRSPSLELETRILSLNKHIAPAMLSLRTEAEGGFVHWLRRDLALFSVNNKKFLSYCYSQHESALGAAVVDDKVLTAQILEAAGVPTPRTIVAATADEAVRASETIDGPVVVKPRDGIKSQGVSTGLQTDQEVREAFAFAAEYGSDVILQPHIEMLEELRVMASPDGAVAVNGRELPHVVGDGASTVQQLIQDKNLQRTLNPSLNKRPIPVDTLTRRQLERLGLTLDSVPELGQRITVRAVAGLSVGGDTVQQLNETAPRAKEIAAAAVAAIPGLGWGGVDLLLEKETGDFHVIEINAKGAFGAALFPTYGQPRDISTDVWSLRYAATAPEHLSTPTVPTHHAHAAPISSSLTRGQGTGTVRFGRLLTDSLIRQGYAVAQKNRTIRQVTSPDGRTTWLTAGGLSAADRAVVQRVMQRHHWVTQLLDLHGVPRSHGKVINSAQSLHRFAQGKSSGVLLAPAAASWRGSAARFMTRERALNVSSLSGSKWVQAHPSGIRLCVLATQESAAVIVATAGQRRLSADEIGAASDAAVQAVRAVPELRWSAVDLVVRPHRISEGREEGVLAEGLTIRPRFTAEDKVIAGDFDAFCRWIVESSQD